MSEIRLTPEEEETLLIALHGDDPESDILTVVPEIIAKRLTEQTERAEWAIEKGIKFRERAEAAESALAAVRTLADRWAAEADERGDDDLLYTRGVAAMLTAALATPTTTDTTTEGEADA